MTSHLLLRLQGSIDGAVQILETQFELVTETLAEVEGLKGGKLDESSAKPLPVYNYFFSVGIIPILPCHVFETLTTEAYNIYEIFVRHAPI